MRLFHLTFHLLFSSYQPSQRRLIDLASPFHAEDEIISECGEEKTEGRRLWEEEEKRQCYSGIKMISLTTHSDFGPETRILCTPAQTHTGSWLDFPAFYFKKKKKKRNEQLVNYTHANTNDIIVYRKKKKMPLNGAVSQIRKCITQFDLLRKCCEEMENKTWWQAENAVAQAFIWNIFVSFRSSSDAHS